MVSNFLPVENMDQRLFIKFGVRNEIKCFNGLKMLTLTYSMSTLTKTRGLDKDNWPTSTLTTDKYILKKVVMKNPQIATKEIDWFTCKYGNLRVCKTKRKPLVTFNAIVKHSQK